MMPLRRVRMDWIATEVRNTVAPEGVASNTIFHYSIPVLDETGDGRLEPTEELGSSKTLLSGGEVLVSKLNPRKARVLVAEGHDVPTVCSGEFVVLCPREIDHRYLYWLLMSETTRQMLDSRVQSVTRSHQRARPDDITKMWVEVPPRNALREIADYLDAETARIDRLVANRRQLSGAVSERPWALFVASVVAAKADRVPLRRALMSITDGPFGSAFASDDYADEGAFVVRLGNIGFADFRCEPAAFLPLDLYERFPRCRVHPGDLLVAGLGDERNHAGRACVAPDLGPAMVKGKCFCAAVNAAIANPEYLALYLSSSLGVEEVGSTSHGSTRAMINLDIVKSMLVHLPPLQRQEEIVQAVRDERMRADRVTRAIGRQIDLLLERRQSLITAAVTGQLDIPGVAA